MKTLHLHSTIVRDDWLDPYGHLRWSNYLNAFDQAGWNFYTQFGMGEDYFEHTGCALYSAEMHIRYLKEVRGGATLDVEAMVFGSDPKRNWYAMVMKAEGVERASLEIVDIHFDTKLGRAVPMPEEAQAALAEARLLEIPNWAGRSCSLAKR